METYLARPGNLHMETNPLFHSKIAIGPQQLLPGFSLKSPLINDETPVQKLLRELA
jgi:hypothetical protein